MVVVDSVQNNLKSLEGEYWTARQRQAHSIHYSISYRASFKPELPSYFFQKYLSKKKRIVLDPFGGRGTTLIQANLEGHYGIHNDINPLSLFLVKSKQFIPSLEKIEKKLDSIDFHQKTEEDEIDSDLLHFYDKHTLNELKNLKKYYKEDKSPEMNIIISTALSRLHGHSDGFFSVYTFPQFSIPAKSQKRNNIRRNQKPIYKPIKSRILKKLHSFLKDPIPPFYHEFSKNNLYTNLSSTNMLEIPDNVVDLIVTSPPFLDKVDYVEDNWIRHWFLDIQFDQNNSPSIFASVHDWKNFIYLTLLECSRVLKKNAYFIIEVGDVIKGKKIINLDELVLEMSLKTGLTHIQTFINTQKFTKLSNCWNVSNNEKGTNSNRCVVFQKE